MGPHLPRTWMELEALVESRLAEFEARHRHETELQYARGVKEGMRQREAEVTRRLEAARAPLEQLSTRVAAELASLREGLCAQAAQLAAALGETWLGTLVSVNAHVYETALRDALEPLAHLDEITVRLHPEDYRTLREGLAAGHEEMMAFEGLQVIPDREVERGGAVATSPGGTVDARLATRIEVVRRALFERDGEGTDAGR